MCNPAHAFFEPSVPLSHRVSWFVVLAFSVTAIVVGILTLLANHGCDLGPFNLLKNVSTGGGIGFLVGGALVTASLIAWAYKHRKLTDMTGNSVGGNIEINSSIDIKDAIRVMLARGDISPSELPPILYDQVNS